LLLTRPPMPESRNRSERGGAAWSSLDVVRVTLVVLGTFVIAQLLWATRSVVLTAFLGVLFGIAVSAGADRLQDFRVPRAAGAPLIVLTFLLILGAFGTWLGPTIRDQTTELRRDLPAAIDRIEDWIEDRGGGVISTILGLGNDAAPAPAAPPPDPQTLDGDEQVEPAAPAEERLTLRERLEEQLSGARRYFLPVLTSTIHIVAGILLIIFLAIYVAVSPGTYTKGVLYLIPEGSQERARKILEAVTSILRRWMVTQLIAMVLIGIVTTAVLLALQVRAAVPLGILAGLLEFVPTLGPILAAIPAIAMGFVDSVQKALWVTIAYVVIQQLESQVLTPILMKERIHLPPALTLVFQALMAIVFGFLGLLVAVPLLAAIVMTVKTTREVRGTEP
jgi:predicted PurR-regulated permease PerM